MGITATQLADEMGLTKGRISQLVKNGVFDGCFQGDGRKRRYDLGACIEAYRGGTDVRQSSGNSAKTHAKLDALSVGGTKQRAKQADKSKHPEESTSASANKRLNEARAQQAEIRARREARQELEAEGLYVLASEVARVTEKLLSNELSQTESLLKDMARLVADKNGLPFKEVRRDMLDLWREHRNGRSDDLSGHAEGAELTEKEIEEDM